MAARYGVKLRTRHSYDELESILTQYCRGSYTIHLGGIDESSELRRKLVLLMFEQEEDRNRVKSLFSANGAKTSGKAPTAPAAPVRA